MKKTALILALVLVAASCVGRRKAAADATEDRNAAAQPKKVFAVPHIPAMISDPREQAEFMAQHYWDNFDFSDTTNINDAAYTEQAFTDYVQILRNIPPDMAAESLRVLFKKAAADKDMFWHFSETAEKYLFDPNSPYRDDELYISVLQAVLANPALDEWERIRPQEQLRMSLKNRVGTPAADFRYTLASGAQWTLYGIKAPYTLVFINNPGCPACKDIHDQIMASPLLTAMIDDGSLVVLAIYPDEDLKEWRDYAPNMPAQWINAYDKELKIRKDELYDLKAIPTLYLLDRDKKVILKDVMSIPIIEATLQNDTRR